MGGILVGVLAAVCGAHQIQDLIIVVLPVCPVQAQSTSGFFWNTRGKHKIGMTGLTSGAGVRISLRATMAGGSPAIIDRAVLRLPCDSIGHVTLKDIQLEFDRTCTAIRIGADESTDHRIVFVTAFACTQQIPAACLDSDGGCVGIDLIQGDNLAFGVQQVERGLVTVFS
ncbi:hypothetical protein F7R05_20155 [Pseudomonas koreensis]|nr:hypothetical protein F7R05_20155 [Pseudomonas koreensis]